MGENNGQYFWLGLAASFGVLARAARWMTPDGKFDKRKALFEFLTAPAIGFMAASLGQWQGIDPSYMGGIAALLGLLGPAAIESIALKWLVPDRRRMSNYNSPDDERY